MLNRINILIRDKKHTAFALLNVFNSRNIFVKNIQYEKG